jgi:large subunit ribosomal protein L29
MKIKEIRELTLDEIGGKRRELKQDILNMHIQQASGQLENPSRLKHQRREIARMETILTERRLNLAVSKKAVDVAEVPKAAKKAVKKSAAKKAPAKKAAKKSAE